MEIRARPQPAPPAAARSGCRAKCWAGGRKKEDGKTTKEEQTEDRRGGGEKDDPIGHLPGGTRRQIQAPPIVVHGASHLMEYPIPFLSQRKLSTSGHPSNRQSSQSKQEPPYTNPQRNPTQENATTNNAAWRLNKQGLQEKCHFCNTPPELCTVIYLHKLQAIQNQEGGMCIRRSR